MNQQTQASDLLDACTSKAHLPGHVAITLILAPETVSRIMVSNVVCICGPIE